MGGCTSGHFLLTNLLTTDLKNAAADGGDVTVVVLTSSLHDVSANKSCRSAPPSLCLPVTSWQGGGLTSILPPPPTLNLSLSEIFLYKIWACKSLHFVGVEGRNWNYEHPFVVFGRKLAAVIGKFQLPAPTFLKLTTLLLCSAVFPVLYLYRWSVCMWVCSTSLTPAVNWTWTV